MGWELVVGLALAPWAGERVLLRLREGERWRRALRDLERRYRGLGDLDRLEWRVLDLCDLDRDAELELRLL